MIVPESVVGRKIVELISDYQQGTLLIRLDDGAYIVVTADRGEAPDTRLITRLVQDGIRPK